MHPPWSPLRHGGHGLTDTYSPHGRRSVHLAAGAKGEAERTLFEPTKYKGQQLARDSAPSPAPPPSHSARKVFSDTWLYPLATFWTVRRLVRGPRRGHRRPAIRQLGAFTAPSCALTQRLVARAAAHFPEPVRPSFPPPSACPRAQSSVMTGKQVRFSALVAPPAAAGVDAAAARGADAAAEKVLQKMGELGLGGAAAAAAGEPPAAAAAAAGAEAGG